MLSGCSSELTTADLATAYRRSHPEVDDVVARCVVDGLTLTYSVDQIEAELARPMVSADFAWEQYRSEAVCGSTDGLVTQLTGLLTETGLDADAADELIRHERMAQERPEQLHDLRDTLGGRRLGDERRRGGRGSAHVRNSRPFVRRDVFVAG